MPDMKFAAGLPQELDDNGLYVKDARQGTAVLPLEYAPDSRRDDDE